MDFEYGIIGGGPAGYTLALNLAKKGATVVLFEKDKIGGTCLNKGCIPTKSMLHSSEVYSQIKQAEKYGIDFEIKNFDFLKVIEKRNSIVEKIRKSLETAIKNAGINIVYAKAEVKEDNLIIADNNEYKVQNIILATGSKPKEIKGLEFDGKFVLSSDDLLNISELPKSVLIVGSGAIGIEWARIFSDFGVDVSLVELAEHLTPLADIEVSKRIERIFKLKKIKYYLNDSVEKIDKKLVTLKSGVTIEPDFVLCAVGRTPIKQDNVKGVIIGDACGELMLAHYAIQQAINYVEGRDLSLDKTFIPSVIYGEPEIAWVGIREQDCDETYRKVTLPITALGKAWCDDTTDGFIKLIAKDGYIKGAHIVSKEASSLVQQVLIAMQHGITMEDLTKVCFAHPTYSEGILETIMRF